MNGLIEGQDLYFVPSSQYRNHETVKVLKVGRKWAGLSNGRRIDLETLEADGAGYSSPGRAWHSKEIYEANEALRAAWSDLRNDIYKLWKAPPGVTLEVIDELRRSIGLEVAVRLALSSQGGGE